MGATILIIEDTEAHRVLLRDILALTGKEIIEATNGEEGIRLAKEIKPELVFMDLHLPDMDGITATKILKEDPLTGDIPIVAIGSYESSQEKRLFLAIGGNVYLSKPLDVEVILSVVKQLLARH
ncbi:two-component system, cell cycle response regulator DivK [Thermanaeromonas toyohensis ToBE]|uniref:Stage 0 sporulation protein A homolog n=2 Tax=Thermanaeromonas TaxID=202949 RepID=A0A1W1V8C3_9FIRM|nr:two-component system, cell cycle response regulator DivK [Thermanaeromonas toyohensis ToBE]